MRATLATFVPPSDTATMFAHRISRFISEELKLPIVHGKELAREKPDVLLLCAGGVAFCSYLEAVGAVVQRAQRVVWICNDHMTRVPSATGKGESPFRRAFQVRHEKRLPYVDFWSTVQQHADFSKLSSLVCWNKLAYRPPIDAPSQRPRSLVYYGSFRENRLDVLDQYLAEPIVPTYVSNASGRFAERYAMCNHLPSLPQATLIQELSRYGAGLYVEDESTSDGTFSEPPACRFFEMLSAGLPMIFQPEAASGTMARAGFDASQYVARNAREVGRLMSRCREMAAAQQKWRRDFRAEVRDDLHKAWRKMQRVMR